MLFLILGDDVQIVLNTRVSYYIQVFKHKIRLAEKDFAVHAQHVIFIRIYEGFHREKKPRSWAGGDHIYIYMYENVKERLRVWGKLRVSGALRSCALRT